MTYRETAIALAKRVPGNFVGVILNDATSILPVRWDVSAFSTLAGLRDWYEEIAGAPTLFYYLAAFDKTQSSLVPAGEAVAPPKPGQPGFDVFRLWRAPAFRRSGSLVSGDPVRKESSWFAPALIGVALGAAWYATSREVKKLKAGRHA